MEKFGLSGFSLADAQPPRAKGAWKLYEIEAVVWDGRSLRIEMQDHTRSVTISFDLPTSFRSQDEGDMLDYWTVRKAEEIEVATLYTIEQSPYLEWLSANSVAGLTGPQKHWLIAGLNQCVEVICDADDLPTIEMRILK